MNKRLLSYGALLLSASLVAGCQTKKIKLDYDQVHSFKVKVVGISGGTKPLECKSGSGPDWCQGYANCEAAGIEMGLSSECPLEYPVDTAEVTVEIVAEALNVNGESIDYNGNVMLDPRPGRIPSTDPNYNPLGTMITFENGFASAKLQVNQAYGAMRIWVEDCGAWWDDVEEEGTINTTYGTFATGVSDPVYFKGPTLVQMQSTTDNTTSALVPKGADVCAILADPRYQYGEDSTRDENSQDAPEMGIQGNFITEDGELANTGPAQMGSFMTVDRGRLVVTALDNAGFFVTDIDPVTNKATPVDKPGTKVEAFNHLYVFNFNYPEGMVVGSVLKSIQGAPIEFTGTTQLQQPSWTYETVKNEETGLDEPVILSADEMPKPVTLSADTYAASLKTYGRNDGTKLELEYLEGALVTMRNLAPAAGYWIHFSDGSSLSANCDSNNSGGIERGGNQQGAGQESDTVAELRENYPLLADACGVTASDQFGAYNPANAFEYCCERVCYQDIACTEESSFVSYYQWAASVTGKYEDDGSCLNQYGIQQTTDKKSGKACFAKIAIISTYAKPEFDPQAFAREQLAKPANQRECLEVTGNLRQVLAARPTWVIILRGPDDLKVHKCE